MRCDVGVVIVSYNSAHVIEGLLATIPKALGGLTAVVVVVDNGSSDGSIEVLAGIGGCTVIKSHNNGYAGGVNVGVNALPDVETILVLNPDVRLEPGSVETMFATLQATRAGVVAPKVLEPDGALFRSLRREPTLLRAAGLGWTQRPLFDEYVSDRGTYEHRKVVDWALGAALMVRREVDAALGGWDESFFLYSEETDFSLRAADLGWPTIYEPGAVVVHIGGASGRSPTTHAMQTLNRVRLYARRHTTVAGAAYFCLAVAAEASRLLRGQKESRVAIDALLRPSSRPAELDCSGSFLPR
jgi:N-acetylglucosaminyl-diphospho-decaprenol L-rhamnosyltransferase